MISAAVSAITAVVARSRQEQQLPGDIYCIAVSAVTAVVARSWLEQQLPGNIYSCILAVSVVVTVLTE